MERTCLHSQETGPGVVGTAVAETRQEAQQETDEVCMARVKVLLPVSCDCGVLGGLGGA